MNDVIYFNIKIVRQARPSLIQLCKRVLTACLMDKVANLMSWRVRLYLYIVDMML